MSRKSTKEGEASSFGKLMGWTVVLALVFSAGLITGQRLLRRQAMPPLVSLQTTQKAAEPMDTGEERLPTTFSFYEHLGEKPEIEEAEKKPEKKAKTAEKPPKAEPAKPPVAEKPEPPAEKAESAAVESAEEPETPPSNAAEKVIKEVARVLDDEPEEAKLPARYTLQVGSHADRTSADRQIDKLEKMGLEPHIITVEVPERGRFYRVRIGKFHSMEEARNFQGEMQANRGVASFVSPI